MVGVITQRHAIKPLDPAGSRQSGGCWSLLYEVPVISALPISQTIMAYEFELISFTRRSWVEIEKKSALLKNSHV